MTENDLRKLSTEVVAAAKFGEARVFELLTARLGDQPAGGGGDGTVKVSEAQLSDASDSFARAFWDEAVRGEAFPVPRAC